MAISTEIVGRTFGPFVRDYTFKDLEICALGCGADWDGKTDLEYVNEHDAENPRLKVLPIFGVPLTVNEEVTTTLDYGFDYSGSLHYGIDAHFHAPFKMNDHVETYVVQEAIWDRGEGRGSLSKQVGKSYSADGVHLCTVETYDCCIYDGGFGGERPPKDPTASRISPTRRCAAISGPSSTGSWATGTSSTSIGPTPSRPGWRAPSTTVSARPASPCATSSRCSSPGSPSACAASSAASLLRCCRARAFAPRCGRWARARPASAWWTRTMGRPGRF